MVTKGFLTRWQLFRGSSYLKYRIANKLNTVGQQLLSKGLKYVTTPKPTNNTTIYNSFLQYRHKMYSRYFFKESNNNKPNHPFKCKSQFTPPIPDNNNPLARREAQAEGRRPEGEGANIDRRLVPYHEKSMRIQSRIEFIYIYMHQLRSFLRRRAKIGYWVNVWGKQ